MTDVPAIEHTLGVELDKVTGRPDDADALTVTGDAVIFLLPTVGIVTVWLSLFTWKLRLTDGAAANVASPAWSATTVQTPEESSVITSPLEPPDPHTNGVVDVKVTASRDDAVARTVNGGWFTFLSATEPKLMV